MLACGEDLGLIPSCVHPVCSLNHSQFSPFPARGYLSFIFLIFSLLLTKTKVSSNSLIFVQVMQDLGLIGLRIQRMPSEPDLEFGIPSQYSYMTVRSCDTARLSCTHFIVVQYGITRVEC